MPNDPPPGVWGPLHPKVSNLSADWMTAPMLRGDRPPPSSLNTKWHPRSTSFFLERRPNWKEGASSQLERQRTKKKNKDGQQPSSLASQGGEKVADRAETVRWEEGELQLRAGAFFPLEPICFLEMLLSFNKSLIRRITRNPPAAAHWLQLKQAHARARPPHFLSSVHTRQTSGVHPL